MIYKKMVCYNCFMRILEVPIEKSDLLDSEFVHYGPMVKGVVDLKRGLLGIDAQMHADIEKFLLENGSNQEDLWGINLYPEEEDFIEFDSLINIRPKQGNPSRTVEDLETQNKIRELVEKWVK